MKPFLICALLCSALAFWVLAQTPAGPRPLADFVPASPMLYLEAKDFASLLRDWNASAEKRGWLASENYQAFSRSRLYLRLKQSYDEYAVAAGFPPDLALAESVAGGESALALYDIGKLEFLYLTRLPSARAIESVLYKARASYSPRQAGNSPYYVKTDPATHKVSAFALVNDMLLLATREEALAGALLLIAGQPAPSPPVRQEQWFADAVAAAPPEPVELRLVTNLARLTRSPHFQSYWIQGNITELRQYRAGIAWIRRSPGEMREERVLLRAEPGTPVAAGPAAELMRLVPDDAGFYRAWSTDDVALAMDLLERKVLAPHSGVAPPSKSAPAFNPGEGVVGSGADLEVRIDEPPPEIAQARFNPGPLRALLEAAKLTGALQVQSARLLPGGVLVTTDACIALLASSDWNEQAARQAVAASAENLSLSPPVVVARGRLLLIGSRAELVTAMVNRVSGAAPAASGSYIAGFRMSREMPNYNRLMSLLDRAAAPGPIGGPEGREPQFFSENLASLARSLGRVESASIVVRDAGPTVAQSVTYRLVR